MANIELNRNTLDWRKSSKSLHGNCVEVAFVDDYVLVRHSRRPDGEILIYTREEFAAFIKGAKEGEFDGIAIHQLIPQEG